MMKFAPHITIYGFEEAIDFQNEVIWTFSKNLVGISSIRHRLNIHIVNSKTSERESLEGSIKSVWKYISIDQYVKASEQKRKEILLELIVSCFLSIGERLEWNIAAINQAKDKSVSEQICFQYRSKSRFNKKRNIEAAIELALSKDRVSIWGLFYVKNQEEPIRRHIVDTYAHQISTIRNFGAPKWLDELNFGFQFKNGMSISVSPNNGESCWSKTRNKKDDWFQKTIIYDRDNSLEDMVKLINC
ncbi:MAG: hypothetical protein HRT58_15365 [Crocinitomicaceae bacterium]|nr:hypothetical protein [Flavobacteriales bacterium]NQZ37047.1 hypothetical protein [Crocinitomicaceae bacterium]